jgi:hypothetical protein
VCDRRGAAKPQQKKRRSTTYFSSSLLIVVVLIVISMPPIPERRQSLPEEEEEEVVVVPFRFDDQTEEERRLVRRRQRRLFLKMNNDTEAMEDPLRPEWSQYCQENSEIFRTGVRRPRELQMDGKIIQFIGERAEQQIHKLLQVPRYDPIRVTRRLRRRFHSPNVGFDWNDLGTRCGAAFFAVPSHVQFLNGPLQADFQPRERVVVVRQRRKASQEDGVEEEHPEEQKAKKNGQASASEKAVRKIYETLKRKHDSIEEQNEGSVEGLPVDQKQTAKKRIKEEGRDQVDATRLLVNPQSFTQTVENIFHFSFLVNSAKARIDVVNDRPVVAPTSELEQDSDDRPPARQAIVAFTMQDFRRICRANKLNKGYVPHRSTGIAEDSANNDDQEITNYHNDDDDQENRKDDDDQGVMIDDVNKGVMNDDDEKSTQGSFAESSPPSGDQEQSGVPGRESPIASVISLRTLFDDYDYDPPESQPPRRVTQESLSYQPEDSDSQSAHPAKRIAQDTFATQPEETDTADQYSMRYDNDEDWL